MERARILLGCLFGARIAFAAPVGDSAATEAPLPPPTDSVASPLADIRSDSVGPVTDSIVDSAAGRSGARPAFAIPSLGWSLGAGAPSFPFRSRFATELTARASRDSLSIDQPWDGSQLGFATGCELGLQRGFVRGVLGAEWSFWDSRSVSRSLRDGALMERTWRVDQLMGLAGVDLLMPRRLLTVTGATDPYFGIRAAYGIGRLVGLGRVWAYGGGMQAHLGADVVSYGPFVLGGHLGWNSLSLSSTQPTSRVLYDGGSSESVSWNGSGLWLTLTLRLRPTPPPLDTAKTRTPRSRGPEAPADSGATR